MAARYYDDPSELERQALLDQLGRPSRAQRRGQQPTAEPFDLSGYARRGGGGGGGVLRNAATGAAIGSVIPGVGSAIGAGAGAAFGAIKGLFSRRAATAPTDFAVADARDAIGRAYQQYLGRAASPAEIEAQLRGQGWEPGDRWVGEAGLTSVIDSIRRSEEAQRYRTPAPAQRPARDFSGWGSYMPEGLDPSKVQGGHDSPKYQIARVLSHFDPRQGITPEVIEALNTLGIGTFSGSKDRLYVSGEVDPRFEGVTGSDIIRGFKTGQGSWVGWGAGAEGPGVRPPVPSSLSAIRGLVPTDTSFFNRLQNQLIEILGGPEALERQALLELLRR